MLVLHLVSELSEFDQPIVHRNIREALERLLNALREAEVFEDISVVLPMSRGMKCLQLITKSSFH